MYVPIEQLHKTRSSLSTKEEQLVVQLLDDKMKRLIHSKRIERLWKQERKIYNKPTITVAIGMFGEQKIPRATHFVSLHSLVRQAWWRDIWTSRAYLRLLHQMTLRTCLLGGSYVRHNYALFTFRNVKELVENSTGCQEFIRFYEQQGVDVTVQFRYGTYGDANNTIIELVLKQT
jgi:hypothetical protein